MESSYRTIAAPVEAEIEEKKSRFICALFPVEAEEDALARLASVRSAHPTARHHVYAYRLRAGGRVRYSDDGEPQKTAGLPSLAVLEGADIVDILCVTTRYFGGTLLGTGGLVRAYTAAVQAALAQADIVHYRLCRELLLAMPYTLYEPVKRRIADKHLQIVEESFAEDVSLTVRAPTECADGLACDLVDFCQGRIDWMLDGESFQPFSETTR